ncbi:hypothetical protein GPROT2_03926, partial [Gammaproteobacteria bacterium]
VAELLKQVRSRTLAAQLHQDLPFEQVVERVNPVRSLAHTPLFQVAFNWQSAFVHDEEVGPLRLTALPPHDEQSKFDLTLSVSEDAERLDTSLEYASALFDQSTAHRILESYLRVLQAMAADEAGSVGRLPLVPEAERRRLLVDWNATATPFADHHAAHELFEARARRTPDAIALVQGERRISFAELDSQANRLAHHLRRLGVRPDERVAVCLQRGPLRVMAMLAVLKAGGAFVPLDPAYPAERLAAMCDDSGPVAAITEPAVAAGLQLVLRAASPATRWVDLAEAETWRHEPDTSPGREITGLTPKHLAYVVYTSGSTGRPKGVMVEHRGLCNLALAPMRGLDIGPDSRVLQFSSFSFDAFVWEVFTALCRGASLHFAAADTLLAGEALQQALREGAISHVTLTPAVLASLPADATLEPVQTLVLAGEAVTPETVRRFA